MRLTYEPFSKPALHFCEEACHTIESGASDVAACPTRLGLGPLIYAMLPRDCFIYAISARAPAGPVGDVAACPTRLGLQGYLAHKKHPPP